MCTKNRTVDFMSNVNVPPIRVAFGNTLLKGKSKLCAVTLQVYSGHDASGGLDPSAAI